VSLPHPLAAVVFDMDGLLFDTERLYERAALAAAAQLDCEMTTEFFRSTVGSPWVVTRMRLLDLYGPAFAVDRLREVAMGIFRELIEEELALKPGALELLDLLDRAGVRRAIATTSMPATARHHLEFHGLVERFHAVVAQGDYVAAKPAPDPFLKAAERLGVPPALCLALEDSHNGVRSAAAAGMTTIMVPDLLPATDEIARLCAHVVGDLHEVCRLLDQRTVDGGGATSSEP